MKTLGLIGGTTYFSTLDYYRYINEGINKKLGSDNFAKLILQSLNFGEILRNNNAGDWEANFNLVLNACETLKASGAEGIVLCANTMHLFADRLEEKIDLPIIHIATATATEIRNKKLKKVALLGTKITMEKSFFKDKLMAQHIEAILPDDSDREFINRTIFEELGKEIILPATKAKYLSMIQDLITHGAEGIILGCTEIPLLIKQEDVDVPVFDTTRIHSNAAVQFSVGN